MSAADPHTHRPTANDEAGPSRCLACGGDWPCAGGLERVAELQAQVAAVREADPHTDDLADRLLDEYGRAMYGWDEVPPIDSPFAQWRGRTCAPDPGEPGRTITPLVNARRARDSHRYVCVGGWIGSGKWWLHCGICRPTTTKEATR